MQPIIIEIDYAAVPLPFDDADLIDLDFTAPGAIPEAVAPPDAPANTDAPPPSPAAPAAVTDGQEPLPLPWFDESLNGWAIDAYRCRYVGTAAILVMADEAIGLQVFINPKSGHLAGFVGLCKKPFISGVYRPEYQAAWIGLIERAIADENARRAKARQRIAHRAAVGHKLAVGDVLRSMWGYDQTNVDYFEVTRLAGRTMVEVRPIGAQSEGTQHMQGDCSPQPGQYIGEPQRCRPSGDYVRIDSCRLARKVEPTAVIDGKRIYGVDNWTAYH